jgi:hypothetical protein
MATATKPVAARGGRPTLGVYNLRCMLPSRVLAELLRVENDTSVYRTRVAANVLTQWADQQAFVRQRNLGI